MRGVSFILGFLCGVQLLAAEPLVPETFVTQVGVYQGTNGVVVRQLSIQTNKLWLTAFTGHQSCDAGSINWVAAAHWFVYIAKDMRIWAYNGERFFILLEADGGQARTVLPPFVHEEPPAAVLKRLPRTMRKQLAVHPQSQGNPGH